MIDAVDRITPKLETATTSSLLLEREALRLLVDSKKGLFLRHHFFSNADRDAPYDAWAEGPGYSYFIEIKATSRPSVIRHALDKLRNVPRPNKRIIIVMLKPSLEIELHEIDAKLLYFNPEKREFENRQELYDWIYK